MTILTKNRPFKMPHAVKYGAVACDREYILRGFLLAGYIEMEKPLKPNSLPGTAQGLSGRKQCPLRQAYKTRGHEIPS